MKRDKFDMEGFKKELTAHILPFWISFMVDDENGGFYGRMDGHKTLHSHHLPYITLLD